MSNLVVIGFDDETTAFEMRAKLAKMQKEYLIEMEDVVVVTKDETDKVKLHQAANLTAAGAVGGGFWGVLIGMIFLNPLLGATVSGKHDRCSKKRYNGRTACEPFVAGPTLGPAEPSLAQRGVGDPWIAYRTHLH